MDRERVVKFNFMEFISSFIAICSLSYWNYVTTCWQDNDNNTKESKVLMVKHCSKMFLHFLLINIPLHFLHGVDFGNDDGLRE